MQGKQMMSSPQLESFSIIPEATDDLWPLITQENNSSRLVLLEPSMFDHSQELLKNVNVHQKDINDQWSFPRGSSSSPPMILDTANICNYNLDSILFLDQPDHNIDKVFVQKEVAENGCPMARSVDNSTISGLLSPLYASDYACNSIVQVSSTLLSIEDINARSTDELINSSVLEPNMDDGSLERSLSLSAPPEDSADDEVLDLLLLESNDPQLLITDGKTIDDHHITRTDFSLDVPDEQESSAVLLLAEPSNGKGLKGKRVNSKTTRGRNYRLAGNKMKVEADKLIGEGSSVKKQQHNAKEKIRRMKLHSSCLALGALIPDSTRSKKRKSTRLIIDKAVEYIPELEEEIEKLTLRKNDIMLSSAIQNKQQPASAALNQNPHLVQLQDPSVSVHRIRQGEFIVQIFTQEHSEYGTAFSNLLHKVEEEVEESMCIISASTLQVSDDGICCHLHIQMNESLDGANSLASLREKVISWLS